MYCDSNHQLFRQTVYNYIGTCTVTWHAIDF